MRLGPIMPRSDGNDKGDVKLDDVLHFVPDKVDHVRRLVFGHFAKQFVVYLKYQPGF